MFNKILIVCVGNICRSPSAELMLQQLLPNKTVRSAGIGALVGKGIDATAAKFVEQDGKSGIDTSTHVAQQLTSELAAEYDLILTMEQKHLKAIYSIAPHARGKTFLLGKWKQDLEIPDPYRQSEEAFAHVYKLLESTCADWANRLK